MNKMIIIIILVIYIILLEFIIYRYRHARPCPNCGSIIPRFTPECPNCKHKFYTGPDLSKKVTNES